MGSDTNFSQALTARPGRPTIPSMNRFGEYIRERRKELGLRQSDLAIKAGLSNGAISMIETGERAELQAVTAYRLARALEITSDDLLEKLADPACPRRSATRDTATSFAYRRTV